jgi:hypothetical protein
MQATDEYKEKLSFIVDAIPTLHKASKITKDRVCRSFRLLEYPPGHRLFREG